MKKTIVAVMVAASAVLSAQAFAAGNSSQPVSYTHLDVYKRQALR